MSSKTRTRKTRATTSTTGSVTKVRTDTEDKLWEALHANPNSTAADLSSAAKVGKSTAAKILVKWAGDGSVTRTAGIAEGGRRAADLWAITKIDAESTDADPANTNARERTDTALIDSMNAHAAAESADGGDTATDGGAGEKAPRLAQGALPGMVEDYLRDHPGEEFSPSAIGKALGRSSGAVNNALEKMVSDGTAVRTKEAPKRFALALTEGEAAREPTN